MAPDLTVTQCEVLETISAFIKKEGIPPTLRELGNLLGIRSTNGVKCHLDALTKKGYVKPPTKWKQTRGIVLTGKKADLVFVDDMATPTRDIK